MNAKVILREVREGDRSDGSLLKGFIAMYRATGDKEYRDEVLRSLAVGVPSNGEMQKREPVKAALSFGKALLFGYNELQEERWRAAAQGLRDALRSAALTTPSELYAALPFTAEYDARFGDKQSCKAIARCFGMAARADGGLREGDALKRAGYMLMALADTIEQMDIQLYEHYRVLADLFLQTARGLLPHRQKGFGLFSRELVDTQAEPDIEGSLMVAYALLKGVRLSLLDEEK